MDAEKKSFDDDDDCKRRTEIIKRAWQRTVEQRKQDEEIEMAFAKSDVRMSVVEIYV